MAIFRSVSDSTRVDHALLGLLIEAFSLCETVT